MNIERIKQVVEYVKKHPNEFDQDMWCGTERCIAGHTISLFGSDNQQKEIVERHYSTFERHFGSVFEIAAVLLDLSNDQALTLFKGINTLEEIEAIVKSWENSNEQA